MEKRTRLLLCLLIVFGTPLSMSAQNCTRTIRNSGVFSPDPYDDYGCVMFQLLNDGSPNAWLFDNSSYLTEDTVQKTAILSGEMYQFGNPNRRFTVLLNFKNRRKSLSSGTPFGTAAPDWYYYDLENGDMRGAGDLAGASLQISAFPVGSVTQIGSGATQIGVNGNRFGLFSCFKWDILSQPNATNAPQISPFPKNLTTAKNGSLSILLNNAICDTKPKPLVIACTRAIRNSKFFTPDSTDNYGAVLFNLVNDVSPNTWLFDKTTTLAEDTAQKRAILRGGLYQLGHPKRRFDVTIELAKRRDLGTPYGFINGTNDDGWYYYDLENGRMLGTDDFAGAELILSPDNQRGAFQIGNGATQIKEDGTIYGLHGWFQWLVNAQPTARNVPRLNAFPSNSSVVDRGSLQFLLSDCFEKCMVYDAKNSMIDKTKPYGYRPFRGYYAEKSAFYLKSSSCSSFRIDCNRAFSTTFPYLTNNLNCLRHTDNLGQNFAILDADRLKVRIAEQENLNARNSTFSNAFRFIEDEIESEPGPIEEPIEAGVGFIKKIKNNGFIDVYDLNRNPDYSKRIKELLSENNPSVNERSWRYFNKIKHDLSYKIKSSKDSVCGTSEIQDTKTGISIRNINDFPYVQIGIGANGYHPDKLGMTVRIDYNVTITGVGSGQGKDSTDRSGGINLLLVNPRPCSLIFSQTDTKSSTITLNAQAQSNRTRLAWVKPTGISDGEFIVQRLNNEKVFEEISRQKHDAEIDMKYFYNYDEQPTEGDNFYRLKWVGKNGNTQYSAIKKVNFETISTFGVFPNPADDLINLDLRNYKNLPLTIRLYNTIGYEVRIKNIEKTDNQAVQLDTQGLEAGYYFIRVSAKNKRDAVKKILIVK